MNKAYKYRLYPNKEQQTLINKTFGCVRFVYNKMLSERIENYQQFKEEKITKEELKLIKQPTPAKYKTEFEWLKEVDSLALANSQMNLNTAYSNFFKNTGMGYPKFKSKHKDRNSYTTNNQNGSVRIEGNKIKLPKIGFVRFRQHRQIPINQIIKSCSISMTSSGQYYISVLVEFEQHIEPMTPKKENVLGLDMDMKNLYTDNQGIRADYPRYYRQALNKLKKEQKKLSRKTKGGKNRHRQKIKVARIHQTTSNQRKDFLHKLSKKLVDKYDCIVIETLNMQEMSQNFKLGMSVHDNSWGMFTTFLSYKLENQGKKLIKVDKWFPSTQQCNECGKLNKELTLEDREWTCKHCNTFLDRDYNSAKNIRDEGIRLLKL